ncbi:MAG: cytochrome-c peroxidase [Ferruginibacter sp.]|nr:cytochrome-c peroxidase [Ferruginibacter sp.]
MKIKIIISLFLFITAALLMISAAKKMYTPSPIAFVIPKGFPAPPTNIFAKNKLTEEGFQLGKKLFYDARLSKDGEVSCASCHQQFAAFATYDHDLSHGVNNSFSKRNAPALINLAWMKEWHWDGGINHLENQPLSPLSAPNEMGEKLDTVLMKIKADKDYSTLFLKAFGDANITTERMLKAITQFSGSLVSANSKYDKLKRGEAAFILPEEKGYEIFKANCNSCHKEPLFTDNSFRNNGITLNRFADVGRQGSTQDKKDSLKFKVPTLRNIALTLPYLHDGRMQSLDNVLNHYTSLDTSIINLDPLLKKKILLSDKEKKQLTLFLYTLTDTSFTKNKRYAP